MKLKLLLAAFLFLFVFPSKIFAADENFDISVNSNYAVKEDGITTLTQNIQIKNKSESIYTPSYSVSVGFKNIEKVEAFNSDGTIPLSQRDVDEDTKEIKLTFPRRYAGLNTVNSFTLRFDTKDVAKKQGNVWEISIPGIANVDDFTAYNVAVSVPASFGNAQIIKPQKEAGTMRTITFNKKEIGNAGVFIIFGDKQYYKFTLRYNITNPNLFPVRTEIALPPQTNYQNVLIDKLSEDPENVIRDEDGNWLAEYRLLPQQKKTIVATGYVEILPNPQQSPINDTTFNKNVSSQKYWETGNSTVQNASKELSTPQSIYDFVVKSLEYNFEKVTNNNKRLGGVGTLQDPKNAVCLEFSDLFIALARSKGIPARLHEGFAYTENDRLRPLSLVDDVLHAWPEYYDKDKKQWIMVDPTWGNTTKGMDYFNTLDFEHITFAVKGSDSEYPIPAGGYKFDKKSKDVDIQFATAADFKSQLGFEITDTLPRFSFPGFPIEGEFVIKNTGNAPLSNANAVVTTNFSEPTNFYINYIPPYGTKSIKVKYDRISFLTNKDYTITMQLNGTVHKATVHVSFIPDLKLLLIAGGIIGGSIIVAIITFRTGSLLIQRRKKQNNLRRESKGPQEKG